MFLIPWRVDVPQDRWPVMNWLILLALVAVFALQVRDPVSQQDSPVPPPQPTASRGKPPGSAAENRPKAPSEVPGLTQDWELRRDNPKGLFGYMWLHSNLFHLLGNMLFLWIFGNALCAKVGNLRYLGLYILFGVLAGIAQSLGDPRPSLGASGAINGVVGAYLVLFFENEITCLFVFWFIALYIRWFAVSSAWMILFGLSWDVIDALWGGSHVGHFAHLGGFAAGFGITLLLCKKGWITMERYEKSLLQMWEERRRGPQRESLDTAYAQLGLRLSDEQRGPEASVAEAPALPEATSPSPIEPGPVPMGPGTEGFIRTACTCGGVIRVTRQYAGRTVRCPRCRQGVVIPNKTDLFGPAPSLAPLPHERPKKPKDPCLHFVCACGKRIKAPVQYAGRSVKCPRCGSRLKIPAIGA